jgi:FG-GAP repeat protein
MEIGLRILPRLVLELSLSVLPSAQSARAAGSPAALGPHRPFLRTTLVSPAQAPVNEELAFDVTVVDPDGDPVTLSIANPPAGMIVEPLVGAPSPATTRVRWKLRGGRETVVFEARDARDPEKVGRLAVTADGTGGSHEDGTLVGDITGDGVMDLVVNATFANRAGVTDAGAYYVWVGGTAPTGPRSATLAVPGALNGDQLGDHAENGRADQPAQLVDLDGDGLLDLVAGSAWTNTSATSDVGAIYVWKGKPTWSGTMAPDATLVVPGAHSGDRLGMNRSSSQGMALGDVTADGHLDLVVGAPGADVNGGIDVGAVYVWAGGSSWAGTLGPTAVLSVPGASFGESLGAGPSLCQLGAGGCTQSLLLHDVSGDGTADVLALTTSARVAGVFAVGAVHVWHGGAGLSGPLAPTATLAVPGAVADDSLGTITGSGGLLVADVSGDSIADVVSGSYLADVGGTQDRGAVYVWQGGPALIGTSAPMATLVSASVRLGDLDFAAGLSLLDWNADSVLDLLAGSAGGLFLWQGGATLVGNPAPSAVLDAGVSDSASSRLRFGDVTGDGLPDVAAGSTEVDAGGIGNRGAIHVWSGGPGRTGTLAPTAVLMHSPALPNDSIGRFFLSDVDGDGFPDVVSWSTDVDLPGATGAGAIFVWSGGPGLVGNLSQKCRFTVPGAASNDALGISGILLGDLTHDGIQDIVAVSSLADPGGLVDAGAAYVFRGELALAGERTPWATLLEPAPTAGSSFGIGTHLLADLDGNGRLDLVLGARAVTVSGVAQAGAVFLWRGGNMLQGTPAPSRILTRASPVAMDRLGETGIRLVDLRGTGQLDLLAGAHSADVGGVSNTGAVFLWSAPLLTGSGSATTLFVPGAQSNDLLGR